MSLRFPKKRDMTAGNSYGAKRVEHAGRSFASKFEAAVFDMLWLREKAQEIRDLVCQVHVHLTAAKIVYIADYSWIECANDQRLYGETKGYETDVWRIKRRLWQHYGPGPLLIWRGSHRKYRLHETIVPQPTLEITGSNA